MASDNRQDMMVEQINKALNTSYDFIEAYSKNFGQLAVKYFINR